MTGISNAEPSAASETGALAEVRRSLATVAVLARVAAFVMAASAVLGVIMALVKGPQTTGVVTDFKLPVNTTPLTLIAVIGQVAMLPLAWLLLLVAKAAGNCQLVVVDSPSLGALFRQQAAFWRGCGFVVILFFFLSISASLYIGYSVSRDLLEKANQVPLPPAPPAPSLPTPQPSLEGSLPSGS